MDNCINRYQSTSYLHAPAKELSPKAGKRSLQEFEVGFSALEHYVIDAEVLLLGNFDGEGDGIAIVVIG